MELSTVISEAQAIDIEMRKILAEAGDFLARRYGTSETVGIVIYDDSAVGLLRAIDSINFADDTALGVTNGYNAPVAKWNAANRKNLNAIKRIRRELDKLA